VSFNKLKLSQKEAEAVVRLTASDEFRVFMDIIGKDLGLMNETLIRNDMPESERSSLIGQLRFGTKLTDAVVQSKHTLQQHKQPKT